MVPKALPDGQKVAYDWLLASALAAAERLEALIADCAPGRVRDELERLARENRREAQRLIKRGAGHRIAGVQ